ncbi:ATP-binding cassette domain-containing protein, partial [Xanthomonas campestris pv. campestris]|nr:ATP-binding cassette domain-containing protein [Xanthomonas campestris pv. campestris]
AQRGQVNVASGECIAICGPSGVGKSTLVKILSGDLDPLAGSLRLGGIDIQKIGKRRFREIVSTVTQDDNLMSGSITQNITGFSPEPDDEFAMECARVAGVHDEVMAMPMRYETLIGDLGVLVSGGQKQRLCLARALYRRPRVLILDEATSHLDPATESKVSAALAELNCTRILIAHRSETLISAGKVMLLNYGKLQPLNKSQAFAEL